MLLPLVFILAQQAPQAGQGVWSSARPPECSPIESGRTLNVWERAKTPKLRKYCDLLASGASKLAGASPMARDALTAAQDADAAIPGRAAPLVLKGRALAALGRHADALAALREARTRDDKSLEEPLALLAWARTLARTNNPAEAADAYRTLLPRSSSLHLADRSAAGLETGFLAMAKGPQGLETAIAVLRQTSREAQDLPAHVAVLALALALDRAGSKDEARGVLAERGASSARQLEGSARAEELIGPLGALERSALIAMGLELSDPIAAQKNWARYAESAKGPWAEHARAHEAALSGKKAPARGGR